MMSGWMRYILVFLFLFFSYYLPLCGQNKAWTLAECVQYAKDHNLALKIQQFYLDMAETSLTQSKGLLLPAVSGYASHSYNYGQTIDRFTNQFASEMVRSNNFYLSANLTLFNGFQLLNSVQKSRYDLKASGYDLESLQNDIALTIATAYLQILYTMEQVSITQKQYDLTLVQVEKMQKMLKAGAVAEYNVKGFEAQAASEAYQLTIILNQLEMARLTLSQLLDLPSHEELQIVVPDIQLETLSMPYNSDYIFQYAEKHQPEIKAAEMRIESAKKSYQVAKGAYSPNLTFGISLGSGYSGARQNLSGYQLVGTDTIGMTTGTPPDYVLAPVFQYLFEPVSFRDQVDQNFNRTVGFNLTIPIFSSLQRSTSLRMSKIQVDVTEINLQQTKLNLRKTIQQARLDAVSAMQRYNSALRQAESAEAVFKLSDERFELDEITFLEYQDAKQKLILAESEMLQAKYEYIFKAKVLDFYLGNEIKF
jgi:outer membrane protein